MYIHIVIQLNFAVVVNSSGWSVQFTLCCDSSAQFRFRSHSSSSATVILRTVHRAHATKQTCTPDFFYFFFFFSFSFTFLLFCSLVCSLVLKCSGRISLPQKYEIKECMRNPRVLVGHGGEWTERGETRRSCHAHVSWDFYLGRET